MKEYIQGNPDNVLDYHLTILNMRKVLKKACRITEEFDGTIYPSLHIDTETDKQAYRYAEEHIGNEKAKQLRAFIKYDVFFGYFKEGIETMDFYLASIDTYCVLRIDHEEEHQLNIIAVKRKGDIIHIFSVSFFMDPYKHTNEISLVPEMGYFEVDAQTYKTINVDMVDLNTNHPMARVLHDRVNTVIAKLTNVFVYLYLSEKPAFEARKLTPKTSRRAKRRVKPNVPYVIVYINDDVKRAHKEAAAKGGQKEPHYRRAHYRTLNAERYKDHPLYKVENGIPVSESWPGGEYVESKHYIYKLMKRSRVFQFD